MVHTPNPLLSVIIPTRNRFDYVTHSIRSVLRIPFHGLELVVQDNSDNRELDLWLGENVSDERLVYRYSCAPASMSENYDLAMEIASGEYVCLIGDDDGVNPEIVEATLWLKQQGGDTLVPSSGAHFVWPDLHMTSAGAMEAGTLKVMPFSGFCAIPDAEAEMVKCAEDAGQSFHQLPKAYYGIVKKTVFDRIKEETGAYFPGVSPDLAAALAIANYAGKVCHIDYPLFVPGSSARSNAGLSGLKKHIGWLRDQPHLPRDCEGRWSNLVPCFYSVQTIWAEAAVNALSATGRQDVLQHFNLAKLYSYCFIFHHSYLTKARNSYFEAARELGRGKLAASFKFVYWFCYWWMLRAKSLLLRFCGGAEGEKSYTKAGLANIDEAVQAVSQHLISKNSSFTRVVALNGVCTDAK